MSSALNITFVRSGELSTGIAVVNPNDSKEELGLSKVCAKEAIMKSAASRFMYTMPIFCVPMAFNSMLNSVNLLPKTGHPIRMFTEVIGLSIGLWIAMPMNCAFFTQYSPISIDKLEPELREKAKAKGLTHLIYNKGL